MTRQEMESTKITKNINLKTLAITNRGAIPLPVTLVPSKSSSPHKWDGCPSLQIGDNSGWYLFTLCEDGIGKWSVESLSIWGDYECLNPGEIIAEAVAAVGWDLGEQTVTETIEVHEYEILRRDHPHAKGFKWVLNLYYPDGRLTDRWFKTQKLAQEEVDKYYKEHTRWQGNHRVIIRYAPKAA